jgi:predicted nucleic acid-binding protein
VSRPVLVDSSWYIQLARSGRDPLFDLSLVADARDIATCGMIVAEVGRGLREPRFLERYQQAWREMLWIESSANVWQRTLQLAWALDRKGILLPVQDLHIAACALEISAVVLTVDRHFTRIPGLTVTDCLY